MKRINLTITAIVFFIASSATAQFNFQNEKTPVYTPTSIGMVIYSNDVETVWNAFRLANHAVKQGDTVHIFLLAKGVEVDELVNKNKELKEQVDLFLDGGGAIQGCGTCLKSRKMDEPQVCTFSSMADLYALIRENEIVLTF